MHLKHFAVVGVFMASALLAACNNDSDNHASNSVKQDSFIAAVKTQTDGPDAMSDSTEPVDIMQVNETMPEDNEPQTVTF